MTKEERLAAELRFAYNQLTRPKVYLPEEIEQIIRAAVAEDRERICRILCVGCFEGKPLNEQGRHVYGNDTMMCHAGRIRAAEEEK